MLAFFVTTFLVPPSQGAGGGGERCVDVDGGERCVDGGAWAADAPPSAGALDVNGGALFVPVT